VPALARAGLRRGSLLLVILLGLSAGCPGGGDGTGTVHDDRPGAVFESPPPTSPGTLRGLGPHVWEATFDRRGDRGNIAPSREATLRLVWAELDYYEFVEFGQDSELRFEEIRLDRSLYRRTSSAGSYSVLPGIPGDSIILLRSLREWDRVISPYGDQVAYERMQDSTVEGRPVRVYRLSLAPLVAPEGIGPIGLDAAANRAGMAVTPISLSGLVYTDIETGNRLLAEIEGRYVPRRVRGKTGPTDEVLVVYRESRSPTQLPPTVTAPPRSQVEDRTRTRIPTPRGRVP
jgi:hypothetical protein